MESPRETTGEGPIPFTFRDRRTTGIRPANNAFWAGFRAFPIGFRRFRKTHRAAPVFLLVPKLTMKEIGTDNLVICHKQTIEPVIRTFQSG